MKYPTLFRNFNKYINLPVKSYLDLESRLVRKTLNNKEFLIREGQVIKYLPFINNGLMVNYRLDENGDRHVIQIRWTGLWLGDLYSFFSGNPTDSKNTVRANNHKIKEIDVQQSIKYQVGAMSPYCIYAHVMQNQENCNTSRKTVSYLKNQLR